MRDRKEVELDRRGGGEELGGAEGGETVIKLLHRETTWVDIGWGQNSEVPHSNLILITNPQIKKIKN